MSAVKQGSEGGESKDGVGAPAGEGTGGSRPGAPRGSATLSGEDLSSAYNLGLRNNNELTQQLLLDQGWSREKIVAVFNRLNEARAGVIRKKGDKLRAAAGVCCVVRPANLIPALKQLDALDYKVYCAVELAGNTGVWTADIRKTTGLQTHIIQRGIAGGSFYTNGEFNEQLVEQQQHVQQQRHVQQEKVQQQQLLRCVYTSGDVGSGSFTDEDISQLVATLECEDKVARIRTGTETTFVWNQSENLKLLDSVPCIGCPLVGDCSADGRINPRECTYLSHWLGLDADGEAQGEEEIDA
ncbi:DNA-directed RNA polymerases III, 39 kDa polypeptide, putative [Eimeria praecox]|uniref:DNA-directed RNA polymerases III, 39 kDa polypeptide, putative n=1 Tax=Eimeria praecox TaxID=51316 RepID=U6H238_9EIME|nr:DNA-directed RNA polymerases III, 39 kDa polypeptide, putative [Eimeria praecox]